MPVIKHQPLLRVTTEKNTDPDDKALFAGWLHAVLLLFGGVALCAARLIFCVLACIFFAVAHIVVFIWVFLFKIYALIGGWIIITSDLVLLIAAAGFLVWKRC